MVRFVGWVRAFGVATAILAGQIAATAQLLGSSAPPFGTDAQANNPGQTNNPGQLPPGSAEAEDFGQGEFGAGEFGNGGFGAGEVQSPAFDLWGIEDTMSSASLSPSTELFSASSPASVDPLSGGSKADQVLLFGGYDLWRNGVSNYAGLHWATNGLNDDGFILRLSMSNGLDSYRTRSRTYTTEIFRAALLPGWRFKRGEFEVKLFVGPDFENHKLTPDSLTAKWRGAHLGLRIAAETWAQPIPELMLAASFYAATIASGYGFRAAAGWRLIDGFWLGPELSGSRDEFSRQTRFGIHLTGLQSGPFEWSAAFGYVRDSFGRCGGYGRLATQMRL